MRLPQFLFMMKSSSNQLLVLSNVLSSVCSYNVSEKDGTVAVTVKRTGNLNQYAIVLCRTEQGTATSTSSMGSRAGQQDYVEYAGQVRFNVFYIISKCYSLKYSNSL